MSTTFPFTYDVGGGETLRGVLSLGPAVACPARSSRFLFRQGRVEIDPDRAIQLHCYHSDATAAFIYLSSRVPGNHFASLLEEAPAQHDSFGEIELPGQLVLGGARTVLVGEAISDLLGFPAFAELTARYAPDDMVVIPVMREGLKYQIAEGLFSNYGFYCNEVVADAHHVPDASTPYFNRRAELTVFKDADLSAEARQQVKVAVIGDSIASGIVLQGVIERVREAFVNLRRIEVIAPLAALIGLARLASQPVRGITVRVHCFETVLNALPPDYYYSAHFPDPELHLVPQLEEQYREWWGLDDRGASIADTACAGYGWSEAFFVPREQVRMINEQLQERHGLTIAAVLARNLGRRR